MVSDEQAVEEYLWSICQGFDGMGWQGWDNTTRNNQIQDIRRMMARKFDKDKYGKHCAARGRTTNKCFNEVSVDSLTCVYHNKHQIDTDRST